MKFILALPYWILVLICMMFCYRTLIEVGKRIKLNEIDVTMIEEQLKKEFKENETILFIFAMFDLPYYLKIIPTIILVSANYIPQLT